MRRSVFPSLVPALVLPLLAGCLGHAEVMRLSSPTPVVVAYVQDDARQRASGPMPAPVVARLDAALAERNLTVRHVGDEAFDPRLSAIRSTKARLSALAAEAQGAPYVVLVEATPLFYSQMNGRYRWSVESRITVAPTADLGLFVDRSLDLPAFLQFDHQRGPAALESVASLLAERMGGLVDDFLAARRDAAPVATTASAARPRPRPHRATCAGGGKTRPSAPQGDWRPAPAPDDDLLYFVMIDRFANGSRENDGKVAPKDPAGWHGGDIRGVMKHLPWLSRLGVKTVWLSPVTKAVDRPFFGHGAFHGYWVLDPWEMEPRFGTVAELRALSDALHARGMRLVLDVVVNHVGYDAPLTKTHPDWFHHNGAIEDWNDPKQLEEYDVHGLPDLAVEKEEVYDYLLGAAKRWIDAVHPDGFRLDAVKHVPLSFWKRFDADLKAYAGPGFELLGEDLDGDPAALAHTLREGGFDALFDFPVHYALVDVLCKQAPPGKLAAVLSLDRLYDGQGTRVTLLDNHDLPRLASVCGPAEAKAALTTLFALRGTPSLTWGTEVGLKGAEEPVNRSDMRFARRSPNYRLIRKLAAERERHPAMRHGLTRVIGLGDQLLAFVRLTDDDGVLVVVNEGRPTLTTLPMGLTGLTRAPRSYRVPAKTVRVVPLPPKKKNGYAELVARWRAEGTLDAPGPLRTVEVRVGHAPAAEGDTIVVVGAGPELGNWDPKKGAEVMGRAAQVSLRVGTVMEYKLAIRRADGTVEWEPSGNRYLLVKPGRAPQAINARW